MKKLALFLALVLLLTAALPVEVMAAKIVDSGKIGNLPGVSAKTAYSNFVSKA